MSVISEDSVFTSLQQHGPLAVEDSVDVTKPFSSHTRKWVKNLCRERINSTKYRALRSQIFEFLGDHQLFPALRTARTPGQADTPQSTCLPPARQHVWPKRNPREKSKPGSVNMPAPPMRWSTLSRLRYSKPYASFVATTNEIEVANDPVTLLLIMFNDRYHKKARFEARRKLVLMNLAGSIDQRERETGIEEKFSNFPAFSKRLCVEQESENW